MAIELSIKVVSGASETLALHVDSADTTTVHALKELIQEQNAVRFPVAAQRLIFQGQILQDDKLLSDYSIKDGMALHLTVTPGAARAAVAPATPAVASMAATAPSAAPPGGSPTAALVRQYLTQMRSESGFDTAVQTMQKICENIINHPTEDKYRKLRIANAALKARLFDRSRGMDCLKALGFQDGIETGHLVLVPNAERWENLVASKRVLDEFAALGSYSNTPAPSFGSTAFGGAGGPNVANMAAQAQAMLQNPMMAQMLQSDPMFQQMAQLNPMMAQVMQNPALLSQTLQSLQQNPQMMQQLSQLMQDPSAMQRMQQAMLGGGGGYPSLSPYGNSFGAPTTAPAAASNPFAPTSAPTPVPPSVPAPVSQPAPANTTTPAPATPGATASTSDEVFDEDEIAKAIAQSLEEH